MSELEIVKEGLEKRIDESGRTIGQSISSLRNDLNQLYHVVGSLTAAVEDIAIGLKTEDKDEEISYHAKVFAALELSSVESDVLSEAIDNVSQKDLNTILEATRSMYRRTNNPEVIPVL